MITYFTSNSKIYRVFDRFQFISGRTPDGESWLEAYAKISGMKQLSSEAYHTVPEQGDKLLISPKNNTDFMTYPVVDAVETVPYDHDVTAPELDMSGIYTQSLYRQAGLPTNHAWCAAPDLLWVETQNTAYLCDAATGNVMAAHDMKDGRIIDENEAHGKVGHHAYIANKQMSFITPDGAIKDSSLIKDIKFANTPVAVRTNDKETYIIDPAQHIIYGGKIEHPEHYDTLAFGDKLLVVLDENHPGSYLLTSSIDSVQFVSQERIQELGKQMLDEKREKQSAADLLAKDYAKIISQAIREFAEQRQLVQTIITETPSFFLDPEKSQAAKTAGERATAALTNGKNMLWHALEMPPAPQYNEQMREVLAEAIKNATSALCNTNDEKELNSVVKAMLPPLGKVHEQHNPFINER